jgi:branched-chain amino acid transport system permease protein
MTAAHVRRSTRAVWPGLLGAVVLVAALAYLPYAVSRGTQGELTNLFALVVLATMWNLLAGYGGMVSIGQQAYVGVGAYGLVYLANTVGMSPFLAVPVAALACGVVAFAVSFLVFRLAGGYFAIATWVVAEVFRLLTTQIDEVGAGSGTSVRLSAFGGLTPGFRIAYVYWLGLGLAAVTVAGTYLLMRSRLGLGLTAIRDDPVAARTVGVPVLRARRLVFVVAAVGCGLAGGLIACNTLRVQPDSVFSVNYSALMVFMVIIGGMGTIEGPIVGAVAYYVIQDRLQALDLWYLVILGLVAITFTLLLPHGLWGLAGRFRLFPVGYRLLLPPDAPDPVGSARASAPLAGSIPRRAGRRQRTPSREP